MKKIIVLTIFTFLLQIRVNAQCDSTFVTNIEIPQVDSLNIIVSINNTSSTQYIYLNLVLTDDLTGNVIAESMCGNLQLYPNQINIFEIDTTILFCDWHLYYNLTDIPEANNLSVSFYGCIVPWENSLEISESSTNNTFNIYPNPTTNYLIIEGKKNIHFTILNSLGKTMINSQTESGEINIENLTKGIYFLKLEDASNVHRFIKE